MNRILLVAGVLLSIFQFTSCSQPATKKIELPQDFELVKLSGNVYMHTSYLQTANFGKVGANGLILVDKGEAYLLDTPWSDDQTEQLVQWISDSLQAKVTTVIPNHWHEDCMGGLSFLHTHGVKSYANQMTIDIAKEKGLPVPQQGFTDSLTLKLNDIDVQCYYLGGGHTVDNIVVWIPSQKLLFAGCSAKDSGATNLGNLTDADLIAWPATVASISRKFAAAQIIVPGHGQMGGLELLTHTAYLLEEKTNATK